MLAQPFIELIKKLRGALLLRFPAATPLKKLVFNNMLLLVSKYA